jgi:hypothetical protein
VEEKLTPGQFDRPAFTMTHGSPESEIIDEVAKEGTCCHLLKEVFLKGTGRND